MLRRLLALLVGDHDLTREHRRLGSALCLALALTLASMTFVVEGWWETVRVTFRPTLASGAVALFLVGPLYLRGILRWERTVYGVLIFVLNLAVTAALVRVILGEQRSLFALDAPLVVALWGAIALGWLGMRPVAAVAWVAVFALGTFNLLDASAAMGVWGFVFLAAAFLGVLLQSEQDPGALMAELRLEFAGEYREVQGRLSPPALPAPPPGPPPAPPLAPPGA
jgi:hypothetical protein